MVKPNHPATRVIKLWLDRVRHPWFSHRSSRELRRSRSAPPWAEALPANIDNAVVDDLGNEWDAYTQDELSEPELQVAFDQYFGVFPFELLKNDAVGFDMGCGSGRWVHFVAKRLGRSIVLIPVRKL